MWIVGIANWHPFSLLSLMVIISPFQRFTLSTIRQESDQRLLVDQEKLSSKVLVKLNESTKFFCSDITCKWMVSSWQWRWQQLYNPNCSILSKDFYFYSIQALFNGSLVDFTFKILFSVFSLRTGRLDSKRNWCLDFFVEILPYSSWWWSRDDSGESGKPGGLHFSHTLTCGNCFLYATLKLEAFPM